MVGEMRRAFLVPVGMALAALSPQAAQPNSARLAPVAAPAIRTSRTDEAGGRLSHLLLALPRAVRGLASAAGHYSHSSHASHASHVSSSFSGHVSHVSHASHTSHFSSSSVGSGLGTITGSGNGHASGAVSGAVVFKATLTTGQERPHPAGTPSGAIGHFHGTLVGATLRWTLTHSHLSGPATAAFVNVGPRGSNGPVAAQLCGTCDGFETGAVTLTQTQISDLLAGRAYVNIQTGENPSGEVRGQLTRG
jgi:CHRD domain-containing protein